MEEFSYYLKQLNVICTLNNETHVIQKNPFYNKLRERTVFRLLIIETVRPQNQTTIKLHF